VTTGETPATIAAAIGITSEELKDHVFGLLLTTAAVAVPASRRRHKVACSWCPNFLLLGLWRHPRQMKDIKHPNAGLSFCLSRVRARAAEPKQRNPRQVQAGYRRETGAVASVPQPRVD